MNACDGSTLTEEIASMRVRFELLSEATQIKEDGEAYPFLSLDDSLPNMLFAMPPS